MLAIFRQSVRIMVLSLGLSVDGQGFLPARPEVGFYFWVAETPDFYVRGKEEAVFCWGVGAMVAAVFVFCVVLSPSGPVLAFRQQNLAADICHDSGEKMRTYTS